MLACCEHVCGCTVPSSRGLGGARASSSEAAAASNDGAQQPAPPTSSTPTSPAAAPAPAGFARTFYKRPLNPPAIAFSSPEGRRLFAEALAAGSAEAFFPLIEQFRTQDEPAYCGLASLAMVLNALAIDPRRPWKGPWRYYAESLLDCCRDLEKVKEEGIVVAQAACLARCNGAAVEVHQPPPLPAEGEEDEPDPAAVNAARAAFVAAVAASCARAPGSGFLIASYSRRSVSQTGDGHFSPIAAFHPGREGDADNPPRVLVLDTARFKYPPHFLPLEALFQAMRPLDPVTGKPRGWLSLTPAPVMASVLFTLASPEEKDGGDAGGASASAGDLAAARRWVGVGLPSALAAAATGDDPSTTLTAALASLPVGAIARLVELRTTGTNGGPDGGTCHIPAAGETLLAELRAPGGGAVPAVGAALDAAHPPGACAGRAAAEALGGLLPERVALFLAALPPTAWGDAAAVAALVTPPPGSLAAAEAAYLAKQWTQLPELERLGAAAAAACACGGGRVDEAA